MKQQATPGLSRLWLTLAALLLLSVGGIQTASASTAANAVITNTVTVNYDNALGTAQTAVTATVDITVTLKEAAPSLVLTSGATVNVTEGAAAFDISYTITGNANGNDTYDLSTSWGATTMNSPTVSVNGAANDTDGTPAAGTAITLGGTTLAVAAALTDTTITVPYDNNADADAASTNGITAGDIIIVGTNPYTVAAGGISENAGTKLTTITLTTAIAGTAGSIGDVVGEQASFNVNWTVGTISSGTTGSYTSVAVTATSQSGANPSANTSGSAVTINVTKTLLTVIKYVANLTTPIAGAGTTISLNPWGTGATTFYSSGVTGDPTDILGYVIGITNGAGGGAQNVRFSDPVPDYTAADTTSFVIDVDGGGTWSAADATVDNGDAGEYDNTAGAEVIYLYVGTGGDDTTVGVGNGTGGTLAASTTTYGAYKVTIQ